MPTDLEVFNRLNYVRNVLNGVPKLSYAPFCLHNVGLDACNWIINHNSFQHPPDFIGRVAPCNDHYNGEILLWRCPHGGTPTELVKMWMSSPEHRSIILDPHYRYAGIAHVVGDLPSKCTRATEPAAVWAGEFGG